MLRFRDRRRARLTALEIFKYVGPGLLVTVGFIDPGNWASNLAAGSGFGYTLLWMVTLSTIMVGNLKEMIGQAEAKGREATAEAERAKAAVAEAEQAKAEAAEAQQRGRLDAAARIEDVAQGVASASEQLSSQVAQSLEGADLQRQHAGETATAMSLYSPELTLKPQ